MCPQQVVVTTFVTDLIADPFFCMLCVVGSGSARYEIAVHAGELSSTEAPTRACITIACAYDTHMSLRGTRTRSLNPFVAGGVAMPNSHLIVGLVAGCFAAAGPLLRAGEPIEGRTDESRPVVLVHASTAERWLAILGADLVTVQRLVPQKDSRGSQGSVGGFGRRRRLATLAASLRVVGRVGRSASPLLVRAPAAPGCARSHADRRDTLPGPKIGRRSPPLPGPRPPGKAVPGRSR